MNRSTRVLVAAATCLGLALFAGCGHVPAAASVKDFCSKGEKFSASTTFEQGVKAAKELRDTGTPPGIPKAARQGFLELINRVLGAKDGADFKKKTQNLSTSERTHLEALSTYIAKTCDLSN